MTRKRVRAVTETPKEISKQKTTQQKSPKEQFLVFFNCLSSFSVRAMVRTSETKPRSE